MKLQIGAIFLATIAIAIPCWAQSDAITEALEQGNCSIVQKEFAEIIKDCEDDGVFKENNININYFALTINVLKYGQCFDVGATACTDWLNLASTPDIKTRVYYMRGRLWERQEKYDNAIADYSESLTLDPSNESSLSSWAWLLSTCPVDEYRDGHKAVEYAEQLMTVAQEETAEHLTVVAAAYAENAQFPQAIHVQEKAISLAKEKSPEASTTEYEEQLASYKEGKPWRMKPSKTQ